MYIHIEASAIQTITNTYMLGYIEIGERDTDSNQIVVVMKHNKPHIYVDNNASLYIDADGLRIEI